jgi:hypothetical protein
MRTITKVLGLGAVIAVVGTLGWHALAETPMHGGPSGMGPGMMLGMQGHGGMMTGVQSRGPMGGGFADPAAHLASLKTELGIGPQQEPAWDAYAKVLQDTAMAMQAQHQGMDMTAMHSMSDQERQAFIAGMREQHERAFASVKAAAETLLMALDDTQKAKTQQILPGLAQPGPAMMQHAGMGGHAMGGHPTTGQ